MSGKRNETQDLLRKFWKLAAVTAAEDCINHYMEKYNWKYHKHTLLGMKH